MAEKLYKSFTEFWPFYVREHSHRVNRLLHYIGTALVLLLFLSFVATSSWWLLILMPIAGYGFAWVGHYVIQKNVPATFTYPLWSLLGDFKMFALMTTRQMGPEIVKAFANERPTKESSERSFQ